jgi:NADPH2:quinone reductase
MKAIRVHEFGDPPVMRLEEIDDLIPARGQVVVRLHAVGVNPVDAYIRAGLYPNLPALPSTPGVDAAGEIAAIGEGVNGFRKGDRVYTAGTLSGAYAEQALCDEAQVHPLPENVSYSQGAAVYVPYATAYRALLQKAHALPGETILVHGATGGVGIAAMQFARAAGMKIIATGGTEKGRRLLMEQGAQHALDHHAPDYLKEVLTLTDNRGVDVILEMHANVNLGKDLTVLAKKGRVVVIGNRGSVEINPRDLMGRDASIQGMSLFNVDEQEAKSLHAALIAGLANGTLSPVVGRELPLQDAPRAHEEIMTNSAFGKIVLIPSS